MSSRENIMMLANQLSDTMQDVINELHSNQRLTISAENYISTMKEEYNRLQSLCLNYDGDYRNISIRVDGQNMPLSNVLVGVYLFSQEVERQMGIYIGLKMFY